MAHEEKIDPAAMWNERFGRPEPVYGEAPNRFLRDQTELRLKAGMKVLVPADGYGRNGLWLARQGLTVKTVDVSPVGVERSRKTAAAAGITATILLADLNSWNWPVSEFDAVGSIFLHLLPEERAKIHAQMLGALKRGGNIILEAFSPAQLAYSSGGPKQADMLYTAEMLRQDFAGAEVVELVETVVDLEEGKMHSGKGAVVRGVFRKK
jgi:cyclopropane fatty-acyl-phospholipid synthase-like methyltransferase